MDASDRRQALAFLEDSSESTGASDQIVGILKAMKDDMEAELKEAIASEEKSIAGFMDLKASKEKEVEMATEAIETKMSRAGEVAVSVVQSQDALEDAQEEAADNTKFLATLEKDCATKTKDQAARDKLRAMEISAISEAISILNDDDALDVFKKALPSSFTQANFLQRSDSKASKRRCQALSRRPISYSAVTQRLHAHTRPRQSLLESREKRRMYVSIFCSTHSLPSSRRNLQAVSMM